jgi:hypothetical protein
MRSQRPSLCALSLLLLAGCVNPPVAPDARPLAVTPVERIQQPAGTAAGQYAVGRMDLAADRYESAVSRFEQAIALDPRMLEAHNALGVAHGRAGNFGKAIASFESALALAPDAPHVLNNLGFAQMKAGRLEASWASLRRAIDVDPRNATTRENVRLLAGVFQAPDVLAARQADPVADVPAPAASTQPVARRQASGSHEVMTGASNDRRLVQVLPGVYELRAQAVAAAPAPAPLAAAGTTAAPRAPDSRESERTAAGGDAAGSVNAERVVAPVVQPRWPAPVSTSAAPMDRSDAIRTAIVEVDGLEVSNGVGTRHAARGMARDLARLGIDSVRVSDYRVFNMRQTEIHYREGHRAGAYALLSTLPIVAKPTPNPQLRDGVNVRLVVGRDLAGRSVALLKPAPVASGLDLARFAGLVARADAEEGWREG